MRNKIRTLGVAFAMLFAAVAGVLVSNTPTASAQGFDFFDYGWVQGYYGGVHIYVYDSCHYTSGGNTQQTCLEVHYDHDVNGTLVPDADWLPAGMWIGAIQAGQRNVSGLILVWVPRDQYGPVGHTYWWPNDDPQSCPPGQAICGLNSGGVLNWGNGNSINGGNTAHARAYQTNINGAITDNTGSYWRARTALF